jgi:phosphatidylinositol-3-phosphatase
MKRGVVTSTSMRILVALGALTLTIGGVTASAASSGASGASGASFTPPPIKHVWYIDLENEGYNQSFGDQAADPYLATTLTSMGALLTNYFAVGHDSLDNYIAQISGQAPDHATENDCGVWTKFVPGDHVLQDFDQYVGNGCVYPESAQTIGNQLTDSGLSWKGYMQDMGNDPARDLTTETAQGPGCGHPQVGQRDHTEGAEPADQFADRHEGFMYFPSVTANQSYCDAHVLSFQPLLSDLSSVKTTPNFSFLAPNLCNDGHDAPCANGDPGGLINIDAFLSIWVPEIMASPAYQSGNGLIFITFDEGSTDTACCGETLGRSDSHPNSAAPGMGGPGGGRVGAVLISPFIKPGTVSTVDYNHYSALRSIEDIFGLPHLGDALQPQVKSFGSDVYTNS